MRREEAGGFSYSVCCVQCMIACVGVGVSVGVGVGVGVSVGVRVGVGVKSVFYTGTASEASLHCCCPGNHNSTQLLLLYPQTLNIRHPH